MARKAFLLLVGLHLSSGIATAQMSYSRIHIVGEGEFGSANLASARAAPGVPTSLPDVASRLSSVFVVAGRPAVQDIRLEAWGDLFPGDPIPVGRGTRGRIVLDGTIRTTFAIPSSGRYQMPAASGLLYPVDSTRTYSLGTAQVLLSGNVRGTYQADLDVAFTGPPRRVDVHGTIRQYSSGVFRAQVLSGPYRAFLFGALDFGAHQITLDRVYSGAAGGGGRGTFSWFSNSSQLSLNVMPLTPYGSQPP